MKSRFSWRVGFLLAASVAACDAGEADRPRIGLALDNAALRDDIRVLQIEGFRERGLSCVGHALSSRPSSPDLGPVPILPTEWGVSFPAEGGSWVLHVTAGNDDFPIAGPKMLAEGCLATSIAAGSNPTLMIEVFDLRPEYCGDAIRDAGEDCDDGNTTAGDGCGADCLYEEGVCGNGGDPEAGETCDDGNTTAGDGCDPTCQTEPFVLPQRPENRNLEQSQPRIAAGTDSAGAGGFAVVWADYGDLDGSGWGTAIGFFDEAGAPTPNTTGGRFELMYNNPVTLLGQDWPSVGWGSSGYLATFVDGRDTDAYLMPFSPTRARLLAAPERVSATAGDTVEAQAVVGSHPSVPGYVAAWVVGTAPSRKAWLRTFSGTWPSASADVQVQAVGTEDEFLPAAAMSSSGSFAVAWVQGTADPSIRMARFTAAGTMSGAIEVVAGASDGSSQTEPAMAYDATGRLLVTWADGGTSSVMARLYDATGTASAPFTVSPGRLFPGAIESGHLTTSVAASGGTFLVVWTTDTDTNVAVTGRLVSGFDTFERNRFPEGGDAAFRISLPSRATRGRAAITPGGRAMVVWQDRDPFGADLDGGVRGRVFQVP